MMEFGGAATQFRAAELELRAAAVEFPNRAAGVLNCAGGVLSWDGGVLNCETGALNCDLGTANVPSEDGIEVTLKALAGVSPGFALKPWDQIPGRLFATLTGLRLREMSHL